MHLTLYQSITFWGHLKGRRLDIMQNLRHKYHYNVLQPSVDVAKNTFRDETYSSACFELPKRCTSKLKTKLGGFSIAFSESKLFLQIILCRIIYYNALSLANITKLKMCFAFHSLQIISRSPQKKLKLN